MKEKSKERNEKKRLRSADKNERWKTKKKMKNGEDLVAEAEIERLEEAVTGALEEAEIGKKGARVRRESTGQDRAAEIGKDPVAGTGGALEAETSVGDPEPGVARDVKDRSLAVRTGDERGLAPEVAKDHAVETSQESRALEVKKDQKNRGRKVVTGRRNRGRKVVTEMILETAMPPRAR